MKPCMRMLLVLAVAAVLLAVVDAQDPIADMRKHSLAPQPGHQHHSSTDGRLNMGGGAARRLLRWGHHGGYRAHAQANSMYWSTRGWRGPTIPSASRVETATERHFAMVGI